MTVQICGCTWSPLGTVGYLEMLGFGLIDHFFSLMLVHMLRPIEEYPKPPHISLGNQQKISEKMYPLYIKNTGRKVKGEKSTFSRLLKTNFRIDVDKIRWMKHIDYFQNVLVPLV